MALENRLFDVNLLNCVCIEWHRLEYRVSSVNLRRADGLAPRRYAEVHAPSTTIRLPQRISFLLRLPVRKWHDKMHRPSSQLSHSGRNSSGSSSVHRPKFRNIRIRRRRLLLLEPRKRCRLPKDGGRRKTISLHKSNDELVNRAGCAAIMRKSVPRSVSSSASSPPSSSPQPGKKKTVTRRRILRRFNSSDTFSDPPCQLAASCWSRSVGWSARSNTSAFRVFGLPPPPLRLSRRRVDNATRRSTGRSTGRSR